MKNLWINGGFAILNRKIFKYLNLGELEDTVYQKLCKERNICAYMHLGFWKSMNTYKDFLELNKMWNSGDRPWKNWIE
jgi:glucose-1-phosphate cytidylyltransferase